MFCVCHTCQNCSFTRSAFKLEQDRSDMGTKQPCPQLACPSVLIDKLSNSKVKLGCDLQQCSLSLGSYHPCQSVAVPFCIPCVHLLFSHATEVFFKFTYTQQILVTFTSGKIFRAPTIILQSNCDKSCQHLMTVTTSIIYIISNMSSS